MNLDKNPTRNDPLFKEAAKWETSTVLAAQQSARRARLSAIGMAVLLGMAIIAIVVMTPLKTTVPYVVRVNDVTGAVDLVTLVQDMEISGKDVMTRYWLAKYVTHRESYNYQLLQTDYDTVGMLSSREVGIEYEQLFAGENALHEQYEDKVKAEVDIISVIPTSDRTGTVRFTKTTKRVGAKDDRDDDVRHWVATLGFEYLYEEGQDLEATLINPMGFRVVSYRVDTELGGDL